MMRKRVSAIAAASFGMLLALPLPSPARELLPITGGGPIHGDLPHGGQYYLTPRSSAPLTAVELWYAVPSTGFGAEPKPSIARLAAQTVAASKPITGTSLGEFVSSVGGLLTIDAFPTSIAITALVPSESAAQAVHLMTQSYFSPVATDLGLRRAKLDLGAQGLFEKYNPLIVSRDGLMSVLFPSGPEHYPTLDPKALPAITLDDVKRFADEAFTTQRASLIIAGAADETIIASAVPGRPDGATQLATTDQKLSSPLAAAADLKSLTFPEAGAGFAWAGPEIRDDHAATAMDFIADYLFHPITGKLTRRLAVEVPAVSLNGQFITLRKPGVLVVSVSGDGAAKAATVVREEIDKLDTPLGAAEFTAARKTFEYHLQSDLQNPADLAASLGWYATEGVPAYAPGAGGVGGAYFQDASQLTPAAVADVAKKYLHTEPAAVTLRPASEEKPH